VQRHGYKGRTGIYEILTFTQPIRDLIASNATENEIRQAAISRGMATLGRSALEKVTSGITTTDEVYRVVETVAEFASACPGAPPPWRAISSCARRAATPPPPPAPDAADGLSRVEILPYCRQNLLKPEARRSFA